MLEEAKLLQVYLIISELNHFIVISSANLGLYVQLNVYLHRGYLPLQKKLMKDEVEW